MVILSYITLKESVLSKFQFVFKLQDSMLTLKSQDSNKSKNIVYICNITWTIFLTGVNSNLGGTALYVNGLMAPDITLERGRTYTFVVETGLGSDPDQTFQPVYITSDPSGGHQLKSDFEAKVRKHFYSHCHRQ